MTKDVKFLSAFEEKDHPIAQANAPIDDKGRYVNPLVTSRVARRVHDGEAGRYRIDGYLPQSAGERFGIADSLSGK